MAPLAHATTEGVYTAQPLVFFIFGLVYSVLQLFRRFVPRTSPLPPGNRLQDRRDIADSDLWYPPLLTAR